MTSFDFARLVPPGLAVEGVEYGEAGMTILTHREPARGQCPDCGAGSGRVHSQYIRKLDDLPIGGRGVRLFVRVRRFFCDTASCCLMTFAERLDGAVSPKARQTAGWRRSCSVSPLRWAAAPQPRWRDESRSGSATIHCSEPCDVVVRRRQ
ncbi:transposase family protein [Rhodopseudomonas palustris]|uniref:transposase family protein n=1 Tax=Rhodopseudomonas palustris TaxID=1076 RepID=UPI0002E163F1